MRNEIRKWLFCFTLTIFLISISFSAFAVCPNVYEHQDDYGVVEKTAFLRYDYYNATYHDETFRITWYCSAPGCGKGNGSWVTLSKEMERHSESYSGDLGHVAGKKSHKYKVYCYKCDHFITKTYVCSGPPCANPF